MGKRYRIKRGDWVAYVTAKDAKEARYKASQAIDHFKYSGQRRHGDSVVVRADKGEKES